MKLLLLLLFVLIWNGSDMDIMAWQQRNFNFTNYVQSSDYVGFFDRISCTFTAKNTQTGEEFAYYLGYLGEGADMLYLDNAFSLKYYIQICANTKFQCSQPAPACQEELAGTQTYSLGSLNTQAWSASPFGADQGVVVRYTDGVICGNGKRTVTISLECDTEYDGKGNIFSIVEAPTCSFIMQIASPFACPGIRPPSSTAIDIGWILIIVLGVSFIIYLIAGIVYKTKISSNPVGFGLEAIPNYEFWKDLPFMVKEGSMYVYQKIMNVAGYSRL